MQTGTRGRLNISSFLSTEINLTTSSDEDEQQEYLFTSSKLFSTSKTKLAIISPKQLITELVVSLIVNYEEHLFRVLAYTGTTSSSSNSSSIYLSPISIHQN
jgi:hypothetical protein